MAGTPLRWDMVLPNGEPLRWDTPGARFDGTVEEVMAAIAQQNQNMNNEDKINGTLSDTDKAAILAAVQTILAKMPFIRAMTDGEKKTINDAANGRLPFSQQACQYAQQYPEVLPAKFSVDAFKADVSLGAAILPVVNAEVNLHEKLQDTFRLVNSDAFDQARKVYEYFKSANTNGDYNDVVNNLGSYFAGQGKKKAGPAAAKPSQTVNQTS